MSKNEIKSELKSEISLTPIETERPLLSLAQYEENKKNRASLLMDEMDSHYEETAKEGNAVELKDESEENFEPVFTEKKVSNQTDVKKKEHNKKKDRRNKKKDRQKKSEAQKTVEESKKIQTEKKPKEILVTEEDRILEKEQNENGEINGLLQEKGEDKKKERIKNKKGVIKIAASIVAVLALLIVIFENVAPAKNLILKNLGTPSQYYHFVEEKNSEKFSKKVANLYENIFLKYVDSLNQPTTGSVAVEMEDEGRHLLESYTSQIPFLGLEDLSFLSKWQVDFEKNLSEEGFITKSNVSCGEDSLFHLDYVYMKNYENTALSIEEMSPYYIWMKKNTTKNAMYNAKIDFATELGEELPSGFLVEKGLARYITILSDEATNVNKQQDSISVGSMIIPCTKFSYNVDYEMMARITASLADTMEKDRSFLSVYECFGRIAKDRNYAKLDTGIDNALKYMREKNAEYTQLASENNILIYTVNTWVDDNGNILGREITKYEDGKESKWLYQEAEMNRTTGFYAEIQTEERHIVIDSVGSVDGDYWDGQISVTEEDDVVAIMNVDRFHTKSWEEGIMDGNAELIFGSRKPELLNKYPILSFIDEIPECIVKLDFHDQEKENQVDMKFISNQKSWFSASYAASKGEKKTPELPKVSEIIDMTKLSDLKKLKDSLDISTIYDNLEKIGYERTKSLLDFF